MPDGLSNRLKVVALFAGRFVLAVSLPLCALSQHFSGRQLPFPLVGVWLENQGFTAGRPVFESRQTYGERLSALKTGSATEKATQADSGARKGTSPTQTLDREVCCVTPIIAGRGFEASLSHHWFVDGVEVDAIDLKTAVGNGEQAAFRTFSCKRQFPGLNPGSTVGCQVRLSGRIILGVTNIRVDSSSPAGLPIAVEPSHGPRASPRESLQP
jgi:hypothetical protein